MKLFESKKQAQEAGHSQYLGSPCKKCGQRIRQANNGNCVNCRKDRHKNWKAGKDPEDLRLLNKKWRLKSQYNITLEKYFDLLEAQGHQCAICGTDDPKGKNWAVDHCHKSGEVRGILCSHCNTGLGQFKDNTHFLSKAIKYLKNHET